MARTLETGKNPAAVCTDCGNYIRRDHTMETSTHHDAACQNCGFHYLRVIGEVKQDAYFTYTPVVCGHCNFWYTATATNTR